MSTTLFSEAWSPARVPWWSSTSLREFVSTIMQKLQVKRRGHRLWNGASRRWQNAVCLKCWLKMTLWGEEMKRKVQNSWAGDTVYHRFTLLSDFCQIEIFPFLAGFRLPKHKKKSRSSFIKIAENIFYFILKKKENAYSKLGPIYLLMYVFINLATVESNFCVFSKHFHIDYCNLFNTSEEMPQLETTFRKSAIQVARRVSWQARDVAIRMTMIVQTETNSKIQGMTWTPGLSQQMSTICYFQTTIIYVTNRIWLQAFYEVWPVLWEHACQFK